MRNKSHFIVANRQNQVLEPCEDINDTEEALASSRSHIRKNLHETTNYQSLTFNKSTFQSRNRDGNNQNSGMPRHQSFSFAKKQEQEAQLIPEVPFEEVDMNDSTLQNNRYISQDGSTRVLDRNSALAETIVQANDSYNVDTRRELKEALRDLNVGAPSTYHARVHGERSERSQKAQ